MQRFGRKDMKNTYVFVRMALASQNVFDKLITWLRMMDGDNANPKCKMPVTWITGNLFTAVPTRDIEEILDTIIETESASQVGGGKGVCVWWLCACVCGKVRQYFLIQGKQLCERLKFRNAVWHRMFVITKKFAGFLSLPPPHTHTTSPSLFPPNNNTHVQGKK